MNTVNETLHEGAAKAGHYAKDVAATAEDASHQIAESVATFGKAFFDAIGIDSKTPLRVLDRLGLEPRGHGRLAAFGAFSAGLIVGGGAALLFAPMSGRHLRRWMREGIAAMTYRAAHDPAMGGTPVDAEHEVVVGAADLSDADKKEIRSAAGGVDRRDERGRRATSGSSAASAAKDGHFAPTPFDHDGVTTGAPKI